MQLIRIVDEHERGLLWCAVSRPSATPARTSKTAHGTSQTTYKCADATMKLFRYARMHSRSKIFHGTVQYRTRAATWHAHIPKRVDRGRFPVHRNRKQSKEAFPYIQYRKKLVNRGTDRAGNGGDVPVGGGVAAQASTSSELATLVATALAKLGRCAGNEDTEYPRVPGTYNPQSTRCRTQRTTRATRYPEYA